MELPPGFESQLPLLTAGEAQPDPSELLEEPSETQTRSDEPTGATRPCRGDKTPASHAEYQVIPPVKYRKKKRAALVAFSAPPLPQQEQEQQDTLLHAAADVDIPAPSDLNAAVKKFMLGDGPKLSTEDIKGLGDHAVLEMIAKFPAAFLVNLDANPQQLEDAHLLDCGVYGQYKELTLPLHRYLLDRFVQSGLASSDTRPRLTI